MPIFAPWLWRGLSQLPIARKVLSRKKRKSRNCIITIFTRNSANGAQPISPKLLKGLGCFPTRFCTSGYRRALLARMVSSGGGTHRICLLFCKEIPVVLRRISQVYIHLLCVLFAVSDVSKRHFSTRNWRQPPPCLPKSETDGRKSMAAQPFILTIDGVRPFCYAVALERI